jgi:hypothetical protein
MPVATLIDDHGRQRSFDVPLCQVHALYNGRLWTLQHGGRWDMDSIYRQSGALVIDDTMRTEYPRNKETAA